MWLCWWSYTGFSLSILIRLLTRQSSANNSIVDEMLKPMSLTYNKNIRGLRTVPWCTPHIYCSWLLSIEDRNMCALVEPFSNPGEAAIPRSRLHLSSFCRSLRCGTVSNAFKKLRIMTSVWYWRQWSSRSCRLSEWVTCHVNVLFSSCVGSWLVCCLRSDASLLKSG